MSDLPRMIAIDGPAASGKSILAEKLAANLGYFYFDTGLMYRAVTNETLVRGLDMLDEAAVTALANALDINVLPAQDGGLCTVIVDGRNVTLELHRPEVDRNVSAVSAYAGVREVMAEQQRRIALRGNVIMAGRDIGTVVLPDADCKIFLTASLDARGAPTHSRPLGARQHVTFEKMRDELIRRDGVDSSRLVAPLRPAEDAVHLDNSELTIDETVARVLKIMGCKTQVAVRHE